MTPTITEDDAYKALGAFLDTVTGATVVRGQVNRVPMPSGPNWALMQILRRAPMATTTRDYDTVAGKQIMDLSTALHFQVDMYGPASGDNAQSFATAFRSLWGADQLKASYLAPLHCDDPAQMPLIAGEQQWIARWTITCALHGNISISVDQQFADSLITGLTEITHGI